MTGAFNVTGGDDLTRTMREVGDDLADLTGVNERVGALILARARPRTPVRSGRLVGSLRAVADVDDVALGSDLVYAGPIHNGWPAHHITANPFITDATSSSEDQWVGLYVAELEDLVQGVKGA
jgi:hypothetical protein